MAEYTIGEFSKITGLTIKSLRIYHEKELLVPSTIDEQTGYRYYNHANVERANTIYQLKSMMIPLAEIKEILNNFNDESDMVDFLETHRKSIVAKLNNMKMISDSLEAIIKFEKEAKMTNSTTSFVVEEKEIETLLVASIRWKGSYDQTGIYFGKLFKTQGFRVCGKPMNLYYDECYTEENADIESCVPVKKGKDKDDVTIKELPGGKGIAIIHKGPYDKVGNSYEQIFAYAKDNKLELQGPSREVYIKGPGMILKGNPKNYLTEIQFLIK